MHRIQFFPLIRAASVLTSRVNVCHVEPIIFKLLAPSFASNPNVQTTCTTRLYSTTAAVKLEPVRGIYRRILHKLGRLEYPKYRLLVTAHTLYDSYADEINYANFFLDFNLEDTFFSWYLITELHTWILMVRLMAEKDEGLHVRNKLVSAMWQDVDARAKELGVSSKRRDIDVKEISQQFNAALCSYDEGLEDDKILAGAIWRRVFQEKCNNPEHIEKLVMYVRKEIHMLDKFTRKEILIRPKVKWHDFKSL